MDKTEKFFYLPQTTDASFIPSPFGSPSCTPEPLEPEPEGPAEPAGSYPCPCYGCPTFPVPKGEAITYICPVCFRENGVFDPDEDVPSDESRGMTLRQGRGNCRKWGTVREDLVRHVRPPRPDEQFLQTPEQRRTTRMFDYIFVKDVWEDNLKNIDVDIPRDEPVIFTDLPGPGKPPLAFDTIYAKGRHHHVKSLSSYTRMFLGRMGEPNVDYINGLFLAILIDQRTTSKNPCSTMGTVAGIYDYLRLSWAWVGTPHCLKCGKKIQQQIIDQVIDQAMALSEITRIQTMALMMRGKKGIHRKLLEDVRKSGYVRCQAGGSLYDLTGEIPLDKNKKHNVEVVVGQLVIKEDIHRRPTDSVETATALAGGLVVISVVDEDRDILFSQNYACEDCGISVEELSPRTFSFNNLYGVCLTCTGLGAQFKMGPDLITPNRKLSILEGAITVSGWNNIKGDSTSRTYFEALSKKYGFKLITPVEGLPEEVMGMILYGTKGEKLKLIYDRESGKGTLIQAFKGVVNNLEHHYRETQSDAMRRDLEECMTERPYLGYGGKRLRKGTLTVTTGGISINTFCRKSTNDALALVDGLELIPQKHLIADRIPKGIKSRLGFLQGVELQYLTPGRAVVTLSDGESQRIRLVTQTGSSLMGVFYTLGEPSIDLHQRDSSMLLDTMKRLHDLGDTLPVVEYDEDIMWVTDHTVGIGPGTGVHGGEVVAAGTAEKVINTPDSITGGYLSDRKRTPVPTECRRGNGNFLVIRDTAENNSRGVDVSTPLGIFTRVTGVSGSGKPSLVNEILFKRLAADLNRVKARPGKHASIEGEELLDKVIDINQSPVDRILRSNPAVYIGLFNDVRDLFASILDAEARGYGLGRFFFNVWGRRYGTCQGDGLLKIEMHSLPGIYMPCEVCKGGRYNRGTLEVCHKDKNTYEVLGITVEEALPSSENLPQLYNKLQTLYEVGLSYVKLGQPSTALSDGKTQRVKLATELAKHSTGKTIYILDESTTGLYAADVYKLIGMLQKLVDVGNTVVVTEYNLDVIKTADHIIGLGPEGGDGGGNIVVIGIPEEVAQCAASYTGHYLGWML